VTGPRSDWIEEAEGESRLREFAGSEANVAPRNCGYFLICSLVGRHLSCIWLKGASVIMRFKLALIGLAVVLAGAPRQGEADIVVQGAFTGDVSEGFETIAQGHYTSLNAFGGFATLTETTNNLDVVNGSVGSVYTIVPRSGNHLGFSQMDSNFGILSITMSSPVQSFGGYFGEVYGPAAGHAGTGADASISFFDGSHNLLGSATMSTPGGSLAWNGWASTGAGISEVDISGTVANDGVFHVGLAYDDVQLTYAQPTATPLPSTIIMLASSALILAPVLGLRRAGNAGRRKWLPLDELAESTTPDHVAGCVTL